MAKMMKLAIRMLNNYNYVYSKENMNMREIENKTTK